MVFAVAAFAVLDTFLKLLAPHYPPLQVGALRGAASLPFILLPLMLMGRLQDLRPVRFRMQLLRGVLTLTTMVGFIYAVRVLSLADVYAIFLSAPLIVTALSVPLLRERVGWRRWVAICVGLIGVLVMLRPSSSGLVTLGALAAFLSATTYALNAITLRVLTRTDSSMSVVVWTMTLLAVFSAVLAAPNWKPVALEHWWLLAGAGLFGAIGQYLLTEAFRSAPASVVAPFEYTALLWGIAIDWAVWNVLPASRVYLGGGIVVATGLYLIWRETQLHRAPLASATAKSRDV